jgi:hypothetical protein
MGSFSCVKCLFHMLEGIVGCNEGNCVVELSQCESNWLLGINAFWHYITTTHP